MRQFHTTIAASCAALVIAVLALAAGGCNDNPTTIGSDYVPENVQFRRLVLHPDQILSDVSSVSNSSSAGATTFLVGHAGDGTTAHGLLVISGTSPLVLGSKDLTGAELLLTPRIYRYPASAPTTGEFDVVVLDQVFSADAKWDDALAAQIASAPVLGSFTGSVSDTSRPVAITLDPVPTAKFLREYFTYDTVRSTTNGQADSVIETHIVKTLALRAHGDGGSIVSFIGSTYASVADSLKPALRVHYADTTLLLAGGVSNWIAKGNDQTGSGIIRLAGGLPIRSLFTFNIDSLPASATVHDCEFDLHLDTSRSSAGSLGVTNFLVTYAADANSLASTTRLISGYNGLFTVNRLAQDSVSYSNLFRVTSFASLITNWLRYRRGLGGIPNYGFILGLNRSSLSADLETGSTDQLTFYGNDAADPALRPTLTIIYSVQTDAKQ